VFDLFNLFSPYLTTTSILRIAKKHNLITCENLNRQIETCTVYVVEDSLKIASKSGQNVSEN
jgi:hypothetical protein